MNASITGSEGDRSERLRSGLAKIRSRVQPARLPVEGRLVRMMGITLEAIGCVAPIGSHCSVVSPDGEETDTEVVGFSDGRLLLMPLGNIQGITPGSKVVPRRNTNEVSVGSALLGRVIDGAGVPLDDKGPIESSDRVPLAGSSINPLHRARIVEPLDVGIRSINGLLTVGEGQRLGLFAGSGVGKSTLLGLMTRNTRADVVVVGLIGERGREVKEFVDTILDRSGLARAVVVATPADSSPVMRIHGALRATAIAEYFRDRGQKVLLLMDSLTRFAQAQREIALSIGEFPVAKGYSPSVFTMLPKLIERAGNNAKGSITGIYTVLVEGDDLNDPIVDASRAILDGHIVLSRSIADVGIYPAIDIGASISRAMSAIVDEKQIEQSRVFKKLFATYEQNRDLISVGAYTAGSDPAIDQSIRIFPDLQAYISQSADECIDLVQSMSDLEDVCKLVEAPVDEAQIE